ncbi:hypothetical protein [Alloalcanivorax xenomutans]|uniref:hypothetical protein n=1 Tax=Alloalcanivorax xenomutans TaxID=1094342 RepID=UPI00292EB822|nr:hypothetical protein [Alloalcanivorax xenomutans]WOA33233.1 hypothetical protein RVY87_09110 [Alloalcanivorax xenomutans]
MIRIVVALLALAGGGLVLAGEAPQRGMTQAQVRAQFGTPVDTRGPVGQPPISRWVYPDYTVYFENQVVLHSVTRPLNETADNARPANDAGDTEDRHPGDGAGNAEPSPPPPAAAPERDGATPSTAPRDDTASEAEDGGDDGQFRFDPVTGRIVIDDRPTTDQGGGAARQ